MAKTKKTVRVEPEDFAAAVEKYDLSKVRIVVKTDMKPNRAASVVYDRRTGRHRRGQHYGTGILMMYIRRRKRSEKHKRAGGKLYTKEVAPGWIVDFDGDHKPIEIEVLSPSKHFPKAILDILPPEFVPKQKSKRRG